MSKFEVRKFASIPKIVGRGPKNGGRPSVYPFVDLKEEGDGFSFPSALTKKVRGAVQAYRGNYPQYKFAIRELRDENGALTGDSACILAKILTPEEVRAAQDAREAQRAAEAAAEAQVSSVTSTPAVVATSVDDALAGLA
jgi:hypothetical protein